MLIHPAECYRDSAIVLSHEENTGLFHGAAYNGRRGGGGSGVLALFTGLGPDQDIASLTTDWNSR